MKGGATLAIRLRARWGRPRTADTFTFWSGAERIMSGRGVRRNCPTSTGGCLEAVEMLWELTWIALLRSLPLDAGGGAFV